jgi:hypothetical protein
VNTILADHYDRVEPEANAVPGDLVVWYDLDSCAVHSAILLKPIVTDSERLDYASLLRSKSGRMPETDTTLDPLVTGDEGYGETYRIYRRR